MSSSSRNEVSVPLSGSVYECTYDLPFLGLPHVHSLFWMDDEDHLITADQVDRVISAEIPDRVEDPELFDIIMRNNIHGPCGEHSANCDPAECRDHNPRCPCMENGECKKRFPKPFQVSFIHVLRD